MKDPDLLAWLLTFVLLVGSVSAIFLYLNGNLR